MLLVLSGEIFTLYPRDFQKTVQKGMVSQKDSTLGIPIVTCLSASICG